jgi:hypothetical protein
MDVGRVKARHEDARLVVASTNAGTRGVQHESELFFDEQSIL